MFDFDPMEPGNSMALGAMEENGYSDYVNGESDIADEWWDGWNDAPEEYYADNYDAMEYNEIMDEYMYDYDYDYDEYPTY